MRLKFRWTLIELNAYVRKEQQSLINNLSVPLKKIETKNKIKLNQKDIIKRWVGINEIENNKTVERISETRSWCSENINKIDVTELRKNIREDTDD